MTQHSSTQTSQVLDLIMVRGKDAGKFLEGQLSCKIAAIAEGQSQLACYCNVDGRIAACMRVLHKGSDYYLQIVPELLDLTMQELGKYAVFSKVELKIQQLEIPAIDEVAEIKALIPEVYLATRNKFLPHDLGLVKLGAVSFDKGCFRGQEIIARVQYRGRVKKQLAVFESSDLNLLPGDKIDDCPIIRTARVGEKIIGLKLINSTPDANAETE